MKENGTLQVLYDGKVVGNLALMAGRKIAFEYSEEWLETGFSISPFSLPLKEQVFIPTKEYFGGLFGVFGDSLPDGWGNLLLNRMLRKKGMKPEEMTMLNRLAIVGQSGMGALTYRPEEHFSFEPQGYDLDDLALQCQKILNTEYSEKLDELYLLGGTSGGARPKIMTEIDGEDWIIKFPAHVDGQDAGGMEYEYALCAKACGIDMTEVRLFPSKKCKGYFGIKRFDRERIVDGTGTKVKAAVSRRGVVFVKLRSLGVLTSYLFIGKVFDVFEKYKVPVYLATSSNVSVSLAVKCSNDTLRLIYRELHKYAEIGMETEMSVVSVIGDLNWEKHTGLEARIIETLKEMPVCMISYGSSTHNLSVLVREQDREKALMTLCKAFLDIPSEKFDVIKQTQLQDSFVM